MADHDNDYDVDELDSAAVAAAMGFSSFGAQAPPNKKRRFNPQADAVIGTPRDGRPPARTQAYSVGTGANATKLPPRPVKTVAPSAPTTASTTSSEIPLHPPQPHTSTKMAMKLPPPTKTNTDEIEVDDDDDDDNDGEEDRKAGGGVSLEAGADADEEPGPQYLDTSRPVGEVRDHLGDPVPEEVEEEDPVALQARIDAVVASGNAAYGVSPTTAAAVTQQLDGTVHSTSRHHGGIRPADRHGFNPDLMPGAGPQFGAGDAAGSEAANSEMGDVSSHIGSTDARGQWQGGRGGQGQGRGGRGGHGGHGGHGQQRDWWTGYYDPTSNENPWARIEQKLGVPTRGSNWLERGHGRVQKA